MNKQSIKYKQKREAVCRLKELVDMYKLDFESYYYFRTKDSTTCVNQTDYRLNKNSSELLHYLIFDFETKYNTKVYYSILASANYESEKSLTLNLFYVSADESTWKNNRKPKNNEVYVFSYNLTYPECSEFGLIGIKAVDGQLIRTY